MIPTAPRKAATEIVVDCWRQSFLDGDIAVADRLGARRQCHRRRRLGGEPHRSRHGAGARCRPRHRGAQSARDAAVAARAGAARRLSPAGRTAGRKRRSAVPGRLQFRPTGGCGTHGTGTGRGKPAALARLAGRTCRAPTSRTRPGGSRSASTAPARGWAGTRAGTFADRCARRSSGIATAWRQHRGDLTRAAPSPDRCLRDIPVPCLAAMNLLATPLPGVFEAEVEPMRDQRGQFARLFCPMNWRRPMAIGRSSRSTIR